ncbi:type II toxin-antitoxin system HipA family toxin [Achromobacter denitrificans]|uniref:type II toxin-antitoxin system HipA family toxin n=1 Tax=Achromobacter denitrificans TaxID=32002 RepID=UPI000F4D7383|nr:HipA domain-containing protein [Achromobacter denitrificans]MDX3876980.1 HipA domain-containing protein [Achromobacter sp.]MBV2159534.1 HipA domain-containing protein [Achromobacter denitrificans]MDF3848368.1 HipA domain-containing protein [Achromobacter denitrificans]MDF3942814.1 HipA domain-containing protein [Achromobacter denitrificans]QCS63709.1 type II toxin-antitoxin system HipA family toxin [Achromobacter denitrificans]
MSKQSDALEVWLDDDLGPACLVGTLVHDRGQIRFHYERDWLKDPRAFALDPDLSLDEHPFFPKPELGNFGIFLDSSPDRWGQTLMKRREALQAKDEKRSPRTLYAWDFLIGVQDQTRQGALRFRQPGTETFLGDEKIAAPPVTSLRELEAVAYQLSHRRIDDLDALRKWLTVLVAPGASLGGARPKANFTEADGSLWIAKFPARDDDRDVGAWEYAVHQLARKAGVDVPPAKLIKLNNDFHTFCVQRFDRAHGARRFYASAMTLLRKTQSEGTSYLELAQFIRAQGDAAHADADLAQLFRRVAFNVAVGNRDDHLRNHGFVLGKTGWRLAPAFDVNPNIDKAEHVLNIDDVDNRPNLETVLSTAAFYGLGDGTSQQVLEEVATTVDGWQDVARRAGISGADIDLTAGAFSAHAELRTQ